LKFTFEFASNIFSVSTDAAGLPKVLRFLAMWKSIMQVTFNIKYIAVLVLIIESTENPALCRQVDEDGTRMCKACPPVLG
jgi:hypothetical protein